MLQGTNELLPKLRDWPVETGRFFSVTDARTGTKVCVLGKTVARNLFGDASPIGESIRIRQFPFTVIGVLSAKGQAAWGNDFDDTILAPFRTVQRKLLAIDHVQQIQVMARSAADMDAAQEEITAVLRRRHRIQPGEDDDFMVRNQKDMADAAASTGNVLTMLLAAVAGVSLLVGGIGVMNIMLVSVSERTREIGIRMAVGARGQDILSQFLTEAVCLTGTGGVLGIALAWVAAVGFKQFLPWPMRIDPWAAAMSFLFSAAIGIAFGLYPAWRASKMDPVDALRTT
jgi:putative ABC transport system permease protein